MLLELEWVVTIREHGVFSRHVSYESALRTRGVTANADEGRRTDTCLQAPHLSRQRRSVQAWDLETGCQKPLQHGNAITAVMLADGHSADALREADSSNATWRSVGAYNLWPIKYAESGARREQHSNVDCERCWRGDRIDSESHLLEPCWNHSYRPVSSARGVIAAATE